MLFVYLVVTYIVLDVLRETDRRAWAQISDRLWRQEMRDKYPNFRM